MEEKKENEMYLEIYPVQFYSVWLVFKAWLFGRKLKWYANKALVNGAKIFFKN